MLNIWQQIVEVYAGVKELRDLADSGAENRAAEAEKLFVSAGGVLPCGTPDRYTVISRWDDPSWDGGVAVVSGLSFQRLGDALFVHASRVHREMEYSEEGSTVEVGTSCSESLDHLGTLWGDSLEFEFGGGRNFCPRCGEGGDESPCSQCEQEASEAFFRQREY